MRHPGRGGHVKYRDVLMPVRRTLPPRRSACANLPGVGQRAGLWRVPAQRFVLGVTAGQRRVREIHNRAYSSSHRTNVPRVTAITDQMPVTNSPSEACGCRTSDLRTVVDSWFAMGSSMAN
jgi:hypothetical protein